MKQKFYKCGFFNVETDYLFLGPFRQDPPGHQNIEASAFVAFEFPSFPNDLKIKFTIIFFNDRTRTPSDDHLLQQNIVLFADIAVVALPPSLCFAAQ